MPLAEVVFLAGPDPWAMLEAYGDLVMERDGLEPLACTPVS